MTRRSWPVWLGALGLSASSVLAQDAPLSAIDWLSDSVREPVSAPTAPPAPAPAGGRDPQPRPPEPPVAERVEVPAVTVTPLGPLSARAIGVFPPSERGLPGTLWAGSDPAELTTIIAATGVPALPAMQDLVRDLMLARALPPRAGGQQNLLLARIDQRLDTGSLRDVRALLDVARPVSPALFRRQFDAALLSGDEARICTQMHDDPGIAPSWPARIFCLARGGDWSAAVLTLGTARALGDISDAEDALLSRFLDPDLYEGEPDLPVIATPAPLEFRMRDAIGQPLPTANLPLAFANSDMRPVAGRKFRMEAAERLARAGALPPETLLDIYRDGRASASGGVWDRVAAIQALDTALARSDSAATAAALPAAWDAMRAARTEVAFAALWGAQLDRMDLPAPAAAIAHRLGLLSPAHAAHAQGPDLADMIASGGAPDAQALSPRDAALAEVFAGSPPPADLMALVEADRAGEALLRAVQLIELGAAGDPVALRDGLSLLRAVGLEPTARKAALQVLLLDRRG